MSKRIFTLGIPVLFTIQLLFSVGCDNVPVAPIDNNDGNVATLDNKAAEATNEFAFDLLGLHKTDLRNTVFSPYSIASALTVACEGARSKTAEEMSSVLHLSPDGNVRRRDFKTIDSILNQSNPYDTLVTANALWLQNGYPFVPEYLENTKNYYGCGLTNLDFALDPEASRVTINAWVEGKTNTRIKDIILQGAIDPSTKLVITNTVYLKAGWGQLFDSINSSDQKFTLQSGSTITTKMMHQTSTYSYLETDAFQLLEMPYRGNRLKMVIILPKGNTLSTVENAISAGRLTYLQQTMSSQLVALSLPRFKVETSYTLNESLKHLGMIQAFNSDADFTGISANNQFCITTVLHKVFIEVCESGTEAAAATTVMIVGAALHPEHKTPEPKLFTADRPFIFLIQEKSSGVILFIGKVMNPKE